MRRAALALLLCATSSALAFNLSTLKPNASSFSKYTALSDVRDALQAKLPDAGAKLAGARDAVEAKFANVSTGNLYTDVVTSGGLKKCYSVGSLNKLLTMGQVVNGEVNEGKRGRVGAVGTRGHIFEPLTPRRVGTHPPFVPSFPAQYFGVLRTIDGSGGGYVYFPVNPANPYALPSNGASVNAAGAAKGLRAAIQYSPNPDIPTVHVRDGKYYMVSHRETCPGGMDMVELAVDKATNTIVAVNTTNVDFAREPYDGIWYPCAGSVFPYGDIHLGSEEFEPDCRYTYASANADRSSGDLGAYYTAGVLGQMYQWSYYQVRVVCVCVCGESVVCWVCPPPVSSAHCRPAA